MSPLSYPVSIKFGWKWPSGSGGEDILTSSIYFHYLSIIFSLEKAMTFIWTSFTQRCCIKFVWNWPSGSGEDFYCQCFYFLNILLLYPLEKEHDFSFEQTLIPFTKRILCAKFKIVQWFWRNRKCDFFYSFQMPIEGHIRGHIHINHLLKWITLEDD